MKLRTFALAGALLAVPVAAVRAQEPALPPWLPPQIAAAVEASPAYLPPDIRGCLLRISQATVRGERSDTDALSECGVGYGDLNAARAVAYMAERQATTGYVITPWTDAHCQSSLGGMTCSDHGVTMRFTF
ncbi:MAG TPA: hypothetical protein VMA37_13980 [Acetobacteraceae bacterium]|nr:hypothetical protein [Acetobacteraceae bacterium]